MTHNAHDAMDCAAVDRCVLTEDEADDLEGIYRAIRFVTTPCPDGCKVVAALGMTMCDYLRAAPSDVRGPIADRVIELIRADVRRSLQ